MRIILALFMIGSMARATVTTTRANSPGASALLGIPISSTAPADTEVLTYSAACSCWAPAAGGAGITTPVSIANGGTNKALTLSAGGIPYLDADSFEVLAAGTAGYVLMSNGASAPSWDAPWYISASFAGASCDPDMGVSAVTSYTELANGNCTLTPISGSAAVGVMCSGTNEGATPSTSATTCASAGAGGGNESMGVKFAIPTSGIYKVCVETSWNGQVDSQKSVNPAWEVIETPTNAQTLTLEGGSRVTVNVLGMKASAAEIAAGGGIDFGFGPPIHVCGLFNWTADAAGTVKGVRLMYEQSIGGTPDASLMLADSSANDGQRNAHFTVERLR